MLEKLKFWKREEFQPMSESPDPYAGSQQVDPFANRDPLQSQFGMQESQQQEPFSQMRTPNYPQSSPFPGSAPMQQQQAAYQEPAQDDRATELILAKLDAIKSELDALHQRVRTIEQRTDTTRGTQQQRYW